MKTWADDDPKAGLMRRKRTAIIEAAHRAFLDAGYADSSMQRIADAASVSIKTVYRHFDNKDDLFAAVITAACNVQAMRPLDTPLEVKNYPWSDQPPEVGLVLAGAQYLRLTLSEDFLALYRVVVNDGARVPGLVKQYNTVINDRQAASFALYLDRWAPLMSWRIGDPRKVAVLFATLLRGDLFEDVLYGAVKPDEAIIQARARDTARYLLILLKEGALA